MSKFIFVIYICIGTIANVSIVRDITLINIPLSSWLYMAMIFTTFLSVIKRMKKRSIFFQYSSYLLIFAITILVSLLYEQKLLVVLSESGFYFLSIFLVAFVVQHKITISFLTRALSFASFIGAIFSVLYAYKLIDPGYETSYTFLRAAYVEGGIGVISVCVAVYYLINPQNGISVHESVILIFLGTVILIFGQSRTRIVITLFSILIMILSSFVSGKAGKGMKASAICVTLVLTLILFWPKSIENPFRAMLDRFSISLSTDGNTIYRIDEISSQLDMFYDKPIWGYGWAGLNERGMYNHNMYASLLSIVGIFGTIPFLAWLFSRILKSIKLWVKDRTSDAVLSFTLMMVVVILGIANAGLTKLGPIVAMCYVYIIEQEGKVINRKN